MDALTEAPSTAPALGASGIGILVLLLLSALLLRLRDGADHREPRQAARHGRPRRGAAPPTALRLTEDRERLIGALLLGNNLVNILAASLATSALHRAPRRRRGARSRRW